MGIVLFILTLAAEFFISGLFRYFVSGIILHFFMPDPIFLQLIIMVAPFFLPLATIFGANGGGAVARLEYGARQPSSREQTAIHHALQHLIGNQQIPLPQEIFVVDGGTTIGTHARRRSSQQQPFFPQILERSPGMLGTTLYIQSNLIQTPYLIPVLAHELGHLINGDSRLELALRQLSFPAAMGMTGRIINAGGALRQNKIEGGCLVMLFGWIIRLFVGGITLQALGVFWTPYFREQEFMADTIAAQLGQAAQLAQALEDNALAEDIAIPWYWGQIHPSAELRIDRLHLFSIQRQR